MSDCKLAAIASSKVAWALHAAHVHGVNGLDREQSTLLHVVIDRSVSIQLHYCGVIMSEKVPPSRRYVDLELIKHTVLRGANVGSSLGLLLVPSVRFIYARRAGLPCKIIKFASAGSLYGVVSNV